MDSLQSTYTEVDQQFDIFIYQYQLLTIKKNQEYRNFPERNPFPEMKIIFLQKVSGKSLESFQKN